MKNEIDIQIKVPNQTRYLSLIGRIGEDLAHQLQDFKGDRENLANQLNVVLTEAMVNAIRHANAGDPDKQVDIRITISDNELLLQVFDQGQGFDLNSIQDPGFDEEELLETGGRGIFIIRALMDSVLYRRIPGGNVLEMRKRL
jgi:serine/threonine-protein kinase RsbW